MAVQLVTVHHEGAGSPTDVPRGADGGYSYWIGTTKIQRLRAPADSFATLRFNGQSMDVCLSGNRNDYPVTDHDLVLLNAAFMDCRSRGEVVDVPQVRAHRNSPGSQTVCPGELTIARWPSVENAFRVPLPPKEDGRLLPTDEVDAVELDGGVIIFRRDGSLKTAAGARSRGDFKAIVARRKTPLVKVRLDGAHGYVGYLTDGAVALPGQT